MSFYKNKQNHKIAYKSLRGRGPGIIFIHGLNSDMNGAKALKFWREHRGNRPKAVINKMTLVLEAKFSGRLNPFANPVKESPIIMEYDRTVKKHIKVIPLLINFAVEGSTDLAQVSWKLVVLCWAHALPIRLKLYAEIVPVKNSKIFAGTSEVVESEKYAIPFGNDNTPAPTMFFARLNVEMGTDAFFVDIDPLQAKRYA